jgi:hypothetical protein
MLFSPIAGAKSIGERQANLAPISRDAIAGGLFGFTDHHGFVDQTFAASVPARARCRRCSVPCRAARVALGTRGSTPVHTLHPWSDAIRECKLIDHRARFAVCRNEPAGPRNLQSVCHVAGRRRATQAGPVRYGVSRSQRLLSVSPYGQSCFDFVPERPQLNLPVTSSTMPW